MQTNPVSIIASSFEEFKEKVNDYAKSDVPEGTHYFHISATLLKNLLDGKT